MTPERRQFIADIANDEWADRVPESVTDAEFDAMSVEWDQRTQEFLHNTTDSRELHVFVECWNWDGGTEKMFEVAQHRHCDAATALLIYWRAQPPYYSRYGLPDEIPDHERATYDLIRLIQNRFVRGQYRSSDICYDPSEDNERLDRIRSHPNHDWIPRQMFNSIGPRPDTEHAT